MTSAAEWRGRVGATWAENWQRTERAFEPIGAALDVAAARVAPTNGRALDIGCGVGSTSLALARTRPGLQVTGADLSEALLAVARERAGAVPNLGFVAGDALAVAEAQTPLDLLVSRHGVMFFADPAAAFGTLATAARDGAPLVFTCFRARAANDWSGGIEAALGLVTAPAGGYQPGPFAFADADRTGALLAAAGWRAEARALDLPWLVGAGPDPVADALEYFARIGTIARVLSDAAVDERARLIDRLSALLATRVRGGTIAFTAAIWLWTAYADQGGTRA